jgi:hypothetical protein
MIIQTLNNPPDTIKYFYPNDNGTGYYESVSPDASNDTVCHMHTVYTLQHLSCTVNSVAYDCYKHSYDTMYVTGSCTGWTYSGANLQVHYFSKGVGEVKIVTYKYNPITEAHLANAPDSLISYKDELTKYHY